MLVDTVGFISKLPHELVEAFKGTLEQVVESDLILHVVDCADPELVARIEVVESILEELGAASIETVLVHNKSDLENSASAPREGVSTSARTGAGCDALLAAIEERLGARAEEIHLELSHEDGRVRAWLYEHGHVISDCEDRDCRRIVARLKPRAAGRLKQMIAQASNNGTSPRIIASAPPRPTQRRS